MKYKRIFVIVMDSVGVGELPDAADFGDFSVNTLGSIAKTQNGINIKTLEKLGIGTLTDIQGVSKDEYSSYVTKMKEASVGKDTMTGHWEMMGLKIDKPFKTFTDTGFPKELIEELEEKTGRKIIGNYSSSGTVIIEELGERQLETGELIVYTSADSVLQIAANEEVIPLEELYKACEIAREITLKDEYKVGRIIARPFVGNSKDTFKRTSNRHDYALDPFSKTVLDSLKENDFSVISVGKIADIFNNKGITESNHIVSNHDGMNITTELLNKEFTGLCFVNLVDFDALYGHRRDPKGYKECLEEFDNDLSNFISKMNEDDLLIITADHGNDPTYKGSDHTREYVPLICYNKSITPTKASIKETFSDIGATIADNFDVELPIHGNSFLDEL